MNLRDMQENGSYQPESLLKASGFEDVESGRYSLSAERPGYVRANYGARSATTVGTIVTLEAGQHLKDLVFKMTPQGVIAGKVTDEDGDLISGGQVQVYRFTYVRV